jgi:hypothetical protein
MFGLCPKKSPVLDQINLTDVGIRLFSLNKTFMIHRIQVNVNVV